jgi:hypothetical protein
MTRSPYWLFELEGMTQALSDRPADRPVLPLARASARKRAYTGNGTNDGTSTERDTLAQQPAMSDEEREAIRQAGAEDAWRSRAEHGFPERIQDPAEVAMLAAILRDIPAPRPPSESISDEKGPGSISQKSGGDDH